MRSSLKDIFFPRQSLAVAIAAAAFFAGGVTVQAQYLPGRVESGPQVAIPNPEIVERANAKLPLELEFTRSDGKSIKLGELFNQKKPVILSLVYFSCPSLCNFNQEALADAVREGPRGLKLGKDYDILVVSIDPDDTPETAAAKRTRYLGLMERPESQTGFTYLTGTEQNIRQLADAVGFGYRRNFQGDKYLHSGGIFVCTPYGQLSQTLLGVNYSRDTVHDSLMRAGEGKIGSGFLETVALPCGAMRFNPNTGLYEQNPWFWAGTAGGLASLAFMTLFLGLMWRGEWKKSHSAPPAAANAPSDAEPEPKP